MGVEADFGGGREEVVEGTGAEEEKQVREDESGGEGRFSVATSVQGEAMECQNEEQSGRTTTARRRR